MDRDFFEIFSVKMDRRPVNHRLLPRPFEGIIKIILEGGFCMGRHKRCTRCGSTLFPDNIDEEILYGILYGIFYIVILLVKWTIGLIVLVFYDWWMAICYSAYALVTRDQRRYRWKCRNWFLHNK